MVKKIPNKNVIYQIVNLVNGKRYIGSAKKYSVRMVRHMSQLKSKTHHNVYLQRAYYKHGPENFIFEVIDTVPYAEELVWREQYWMDKYDFDKELYNIEPVAGSSLGRVLSEESKKRISEAMSGENHPNWGKPMIQETKDKIGDANRGKKRSKKLKKLFSKMRRGEKHPNYGKSHSNKTKQRIANSCPHKKSVAQININTDEIIGVFDSISKAARETGIQRANISSVCHKHTYYKNGYLCTKQTAGGYKWKFVSDLDNTEK